MKPKISFLFSGAALVLCILIQIEARPQFFQETFLNPLTTKVEKGEMVAEGVIDDLACITLGLGKNCNPPRKEVKEEQIIPSKAPNDTATSTTTTTTTTTTPTSTATPESVTTPTTSTTSTPSTTTKTATLSASPSSTTTPTTTTSSPDSSTTTSTQASAPTTIAETVTTIPPSSSTPTQNTSSETTTASSSSTTAATTTTTSSSPDASTTTTTTQAPTSSAETITTTTPSPVSSPSEDGVTVNETASSTVSPSGAERSPKKGPDGRTKGSDRDKNFSDFQDLGLDLHNKIRGNHNSQKLVLNKTMNEMAQAWAENVLKRGQLGASPPGKRAYAENVFKISGGSDSDPISNKEAIEGAVQAWYASQKWFNDDKPKPTGFSQIVWNDTTQLGIGLASSKDTSIVVATYFPRGNVVVVGSAGETAAKFKKNVFPQLDNPIPVFP